MKRLRVGISIVFGQTTSIWDSGLNQNLAFFAKLLAKSPAVGKVYLLNGSRFDAIPGGLGFDGIDAELVRPEAVTHDLDLVIEFGISLSVEWLNRVRALGARVVTFFIGDAYTSQAEGPMFTRDTGTTFTPTPWDEVWTLPHHAHISAPLLRALTRAPLRVLPFIWSPAFIDRQVREMGEPGRSFGWDAQRAGEPWRVAIFEPNISVVKSCFIPMLACEHAFRRDAEAIEHMMVVNSFHMKDHATFNAFARHLDLTRASRASYEPRLAFPLCMVESKRNAVVAHHWECGLNYAYCDALHGGYPLFHNSEFLRDAGAGIFYPGFEATAAGDAMLAARNRDAAFWDGYKRRASAFLARLDPLDTANVEAYTRTIADLVERPALAR